MEQNKKTPKKDALPDEEIVELYWQRKESAIAK